MGHLLYPHTLLSYKQIHISEEGDLDKEPDQVLEVKVGGVEEQRAV